MKDPLKNSKIKKHIQKAIADGKCEQCQYPWHDGICSCGSDGEEEELICNLAYSLLGIGKGNSLSQLPHA